MRVCEIWGAFSKRIVIQGSKAKYMIYIFLFYPDRLKCVPTFQSLTHDRWKDFSSQPWQGFPLNVEFVNENLNIENLKQYISILYNKLLI